VNFPGGSLLRSSARKVATLAIGAAACLGLLAGCADGPVAGSEIGNPTIAGTVQYPDGSPVAGATVTLRRKDYVARDAGEGLIRTGIDPMRWLAKRAVFKAEVETDARGRYRIDSVDTGTYRLEVNDGEQKGLLRDVTVDSSDRLIDLMTDTAEANGAITGVLRLLDPTPGRYLAYVRGLERVTRVREDNGTFSLSDCPAGTYTVHFSCLDAGCLSKDVPGVVVKSGQTTVMDTVVLQTFATEKYAAWKNSMRLAFHAASVGAEEAVHGFPLLVRLTAENFPFEGADGKGRDIRFADALDNNLHFEIESWDSAGRKADLWVRIPTVTAGADSQSLTLYWGNPAAAAYSSGVEVFPRGEGFRGVWHLGEKAGNENNGFRDASANGNHGTGRGYPAAGPGVADGAQSFDGSSSIAIGADSTLHADSAVTLELWANLYDFGTFRRLVSKASSAGGYPWTEFGIESDAGGRRLAMVVGIGDSSHSVVSGSEVAAGQWTHVVGIYDGSHLRIYLNGVLEGTDERTGLLRDHGRGLSIGKYEHDAASNFNGALDEIRITSRARSASWVKLSYESQKPGSTFLTFSAAKP
jgi:hypothetical protein